MSNYVNQSGGKCPYMPFLGRGQMSGGGTCHTLDVNVFISLEMKSSRTEILVCTEYAT